MLNKFFKDVNIITQISIIFFFVFVSLGIMGSIRLTGLQSSQQLELLVVEAEEIEVLFGKQIQEWKNTLIRGYDPGQFDRYWNAFQDVESTIQQKVESLIDQLNARGIDTQVLSEFAISHRELGSSYRVALEDFDRSYELSYRLVDTDVRGIDRNVLTTYESFLESIKISLVDDFNETINQFYLSFLVMFLIGVALLATYGYFFRRRLLSLIENTTRIAEGDLSARNKITGKSEVGILAATINEMGVSLSELVSNIENARGKLSSAAGTLTSSVKHSGEASLEILATTNEIVASTKEISLTSKELTNSMSGVAEAIDEAGDFASNGQKNLETMSSTINRMVEASTSIGGKLAILNDKASRITSIVTTINKVADQTNLLSVNAAIEADKAGEHGLGFNTVATEIRRLADQTAVSTWEIEEMVKEMQSAVSSGVMGMEKFSEDIQQGVEEVTQVSNQLNKIIEKVQDLGPHFDNIHDGVRAQSQGAEEISGALDSLGDSIRSNDETIGQSKQIVNDLSGASNRLGEASMAFTLGN